MQTLEDERYLEEKSVSGKVKVCYFKDIFKIGLLGFMRILFKKSVTQRNNLNNLSTTHALMMK
jgi:hypothetical protein